MKSAYEGEGACCFCSKSVRCSVALFERGSVVKNDPISGNPQYLFIYILPVRL